MTNQRHIQTSPNDRLRHERLLRGWAQAEVARRIGTDGYTVNRWERGRTVPGPYFRQKLCLLFDKNAQELGFLSTPEEAHRVAAAAPSDVLMPPFRRNPFFTGREEVLRYLATLRMDGEASPLAISGLAGMGKTQAALEYAYRAAAHGQTVLWVQADSRATALINFAHLAEALKLPERQQTDQQQTVTAVKRWLTCQTAWLLLFDNVEEMEVIADLFPTSTTGQVLVTTRLQSLGSGIQRLLLEPMASDEGVLLLLKRAKLLAAGQPLGQAAASDRRQAAELVTIMGGLPLALDQAAAYIEETNCGLDGYVQRYQSHQANLLAMRGSSQEHPDSVAATWSFSFHCLQQENPAAAALLQCCAFLHPDAIPEAFFLAGAADLGPELQQATSSFLAFDHAVRDLGKFSLLRRHPASHTLSLHRLVQVVIKEQMDARSQRQWAERVVCAIGRQFPEVEFATWPDCRQYFPHALECARWVTTWQMQTQEVAAFLHRVGIYAQEQALYDLAETLSRQALVLRERVLGPEHPEVAASLDHLASLAAICWREEEATCFYQRALEMRLRLLGPEHPEVAESCTHFAFFFYQQGKHMQAERLYRQALSIFERAFGARDVRVAQTLSQLGNLSRETCQYVQSTDLYQQALAIFEEVLGPAHPEVARCLRSMGALYHEQGNLLQAHSLYAQALAISETTLGSTHPQVATSLRNLALLSHEQGKYAEAEALCRRAVALREQCFGHQHPATADILNLLAEICASQSKRDEAERLFRQALFIWELTLGAEHADLAHSLHGLAELALVQGNPSQAEALVRRALGIREQTYGEAHQYMAQSFLLLAACLHAQQDDPQAEALYRQALVILKRTVGAKHLHVALGLRGLADIYASRDEQVLAELLYQQALALYAHLLGPDHTLLIPHLEHYACLLRRQQRETDVAQVEDRIRALYEKQRCTDDV